MTTLTWSPKKTKRIRKHGFRKTSSIPSGRKTIKRRRLKGRKLLAVSSYKK